jgi:hypothetical protein
LRHRKGYHLFFFVLFGFQRFHCSSIIKKGVSATVDILVNRLRLEGG